MKTSSEFNGSKFNVLNPTPGPQERFVKPEPLTRAVADVCLSQHEHDSRARVTLFRFVLPLYAMLFTFLVSSPAWSHDQNAAQKTKGTVRREIRIPIEDFTLTDQASRPFKFQSLRGKVAVVAFAYTTCPDVCPLITAAMRQVQDGLKGDEQKGTYLITVTTDPEIDTPKVMAAYAKRYGVDPSNWAFLTGDEAGLKKVWKNFGVGVQRKARGLIDHTTLTAVVDRDGTMRIAYLGASPDPKAILQDVRKLLKGK
jgi:protein SCO1/2